MIRVRDIVKGKSVALVGNSPSLTLEAKADEIDAHDVVIRINLGIPLFMRGVTGKRTTIWAQGLWFQNYAIPADCEAIVFMKLTGLGDKHWPLVKASAGKTPCVRWDRALEDEAKEFVGGSPSTGIRLLYWLKHHAAPTSVTCYGMDCWKTPGNTWSGGRHSTWDHKPELEREAMRRLLAP